MTTITVTKGSKRRFEAPGLGWIQPKGVFSTDYIGQVEGIGELSLTRNWTGLKYTVTDSIGRVRGSYEKKGWTGSRGPLMWDDVEYEFAHHSAWNNSCVLRRHNEDLATFKPKWTGSSVEVELLDLPALMVDLAARSSSECGSR